MVGYCVGDRMAVPGRRIHDNWLVAGGATTGDITNNYIELYDLRNPSQPAKKIYGFTGVENLEYARHENGAFVRDESGFSIKFTDFNTVREVIKPKEKISTIAMSPDGKRLAGAGMGGTLYVWDIMNNYKETVVWNNPRKDPKKNDNGLTAVVFAPDNSTSRKIVVGDISGQIYIVTEETNLPPRVLSGHLTHIEQIVFNGAGTFMASTSRDGTVRLWNWQKPADNPIVLQDEELGDWTWSAAFSPDDEQLMVGIHSNALNPKETIHVYPTKVVSMSNSLCSYVDRNMTKDEWNTFTGGLNYEKTCENYPANNK